MQFINDIRNHLANFETEASEEIHKFLDHLKTVYEHKETAEVPPPAPLGEAAPVQTFTAPVFGVQPEVEETPVEAPIEAEPTPAPTVEVEEPAQTELPLETPVEKS